MNQTNGAMKQGELVRLAGPLAAMAVHEGVGIRVQIRPPVVDVSPADAARFRAAIAQCARAAQPAAQAAVHAIVDRKVAVLRAWLVERKKSRQRIPRLKDCQRYMEAVNAGRNGVAGRGLSQDTVKALVTEVWPGVQFTTGGKSWPFIPGDPISPPSANWLRTHAYPKASSRATPRAPAIATAPTARAALPPVHIPGVPAVPSLDAVIGAQVRALIAAALTPLQDQLTIIEREIAAMRTELGDDIDKLDDRLAGQIKAVSVRLSQLVTDLGGTR